MASIVRDVAVSTALQLGAGRLGELLEEPLTHGVRGGTTVTDRKAMRRGRRVDEHELFGMGPATGAAGPASRLLGRLDQCVVDTLAASGRQRVALADSDLLRTVAGLVDARLG